jgi:dienelactone hydrolase
VVEALAVSLIGRLSLCVILVAVSACADRFAPAAFDLAAARAPDLDARFAPRQQASPTVTLEEISFLSTQWQPDGSARPVRLHGALARPVHPGKRPAVLVAHGLGAQADASTAVDVARNLDVVALAISAPGVGGSEGQPVTFQDPRPMFATVPDVRGSWLYAYVFGLLRAVTLLDNLPDVDGHVVINGTSMGGIAALIANGVDPRVSGILVMSASGGLRAAAAEGSWLRTLIAASGGLSIDDRGPRAFFRAFDPLAYARSQHGPVYLLSGAQDEFFPMDQVLRTFRALEIPRKSLALLPDYDHGWYFGTGCPARCMPGAPAAAVAAADCPATCPRTCAGRWPYCGPFDSYNRHEEVSARWGLLLRALVAQVANRPYQPPGDLPIVERRGDEIIVWVGMIRPKAVRLAISDNGGYTYGQVLLTPLADRSYSLHRALPPDAIVFAEVENSDGAVVTSLPELPKGFRPPIRPFSPVPPP